MAARAEIPDAQQALVRSHAHDVAMVLTGIESLQDATWHATDSYSSLVATQQNSAINRLSVVSRVYLPLTFLTGFFGMNFGVLIAHIEATTAFWWMGVGSQVVALAVALYLLRRTGLWRLLQGGSDTSGTRLPGGPGEREGA